MIINKKDKVYNFAIVGCGRISTRHAELLAGKIKGANLVAVCDLVKAKAIKLSKKYSIPYYLDSHEMMKNHNIDFIVILTESGNHAKNVIELAKYGKHIIVEKPMALRISDAKKMINVCKKNKISLFVVKQNRFNLPVVMLKKALEANRFGKLIYANVRVRWSRDQSYYDQDFWRGRWDMDGGVLTNQASHHIDLMEWMMGDVESVFAYSKTALVDIEAEDTAVVVFKFINGALGSLEATTAIRPSDLEGSISIIGEYGNVEIGGFAVNELKQWNFTKKIGSDKEAKKKFSTNPPNVYGFGHLLFYENIIKFTRGNKRYKIIDGLEGLKSLKLIHAIYESIESKKEVKIGKKIIYSRLGK